MDMVVLEGTAFKTILTALLNYFYQKLISWWITPFNIFQKLENIYIYIIISSSSSRGCG